MNFGEPPQDFHAVFEAWLGEGVDGRWVLFDGTRMAPMDRLIRTGTGRDAKAVSFATVFGSVLLLRKDVTVDQGERFDSVATQLDNAALISENRLTADSH